MISLAQRVLEMAAAYRNEFVPGRYRTFVKKDEEGLTIAGRYVVGETVDGERGLFSIPSVSAMPSKIPDERVARLLGLKKTKIDDFSKVEKKVIQVLINKGYVDITNIAKKTGKKSTYAGKEEIEEGTVKPFKGKTYHGTEDTFFFTNTYNSVDLGMGSHLQSLQGGDAFSVTPNIEVAKSFSDSGGVVIEFDSDLTVYYAGKDEDDLDEIDYPPECDAVAIPHGTYEEEEFAVIQWSDNLIAVAIHLLLPSKVWKRYGVKASDVEYFGELKAFLESYFSDVFGKEIVEFLDWLRDHGVDLSDPKTFYEEEGGYYVRSDSGNLIALLDPSSPVILFYGIDSREQDWSANDKENEFKNADELMDFIRSKE